MKPKVKPHELLDFDSIKLITRHLPRTEEALRMLIPISFVTAYGERILEVTINHERDQDRFEDCVKEMDAFVRGGVPGMAVLDRVYKSILKQFGMEDEMEEVLDACKIYVHAERNCLKRRRAAEDDEPRV